MLIILALEAPSQNFTGQWYVDQSSVKHADPVDAKSEKQPSFWDAMAADETPLTFNTDGFSNKFIARVNGLEVPCHLEIRDQVIRVVFDDRDGKSSYTEYTYEMDKRGKTLQLHYASPYLTETVILKN